MWVKLSRALLVAVIVVLAVAKIAPSSTYMVRSLCSQVVADSIRLAVYRADKIGDRGEPWGVPCVIPKGWVEKSPILSVARRFAMKFLTHLTTPEGKPLSLKILAVRSGFRLSKKPEMSNRRRAPTFPMALVCWMQ
jgi:hypothetical protein